MLAIRPEWHRRGVGRALVDASRHTTDVWEFAFSR